MGRFSLCLLLLPAVIPAATSLGATPRTPPRVAQAIEPLLRLPGLDRGITAIRVEGACSGRVLYSRQADRFLNPASNVKLVAMAAVLEALRPPWRFHTRIRGPAPTAAGVVPGPVHVTGSGDPTLTPARLSRLAERLRKRGVRLIDGEVWLHPRVRLSLRWRTRFHLAVQAGHVPGEPADVHLDPPRSGVRIRNRAMTRAGDRDALQIHRIRSGSGGPGLVFELRGRIGSGHLTALHFSPVDRDVATAVALGRALRGAGIQVRGRVRLASTGAGPGPSPALATLPSDPLSTIVARVNQHSDNRLADALVRTLGRRTRRGARGGASDLARGVAVMRRWLRTRAKVSLTGVVLDTGSGLSYRSRLTARQIVRVIRVAGGFTRRGACREPGPTADAFRASLARPGKRGTLQFRFRHSAVREHLAAKTGTLTGIYALSGVLDRGPRREPLVFSILTNDVHPSLRFLIRLRQDQVAARLYAALAH